MNFQTPVQIAWVTHDLDSTEAALTSLMGAKKWIRMPGVHFGPESCIHRGEPADFRADISLSYAGEMQLEVIAPIDGRSVYTEFLAESGPGLHHICMQTDTFDEALNDAHAAATVVAHGVMPGGMRFAYVSAPNMGVPYIEIAEIPAEVQAFFDYVKREQQ